MANTIAEAPAVVKTECTFGTRTSPCGQHATALVYQGSVRHIDLPEAWRPMCTNHQRTVSGAHIAEATPLDTGDTWVVALRKLPEVTS